MHLGKNSSPQSLAGLFISVPIFNLFIELDDGTALQVRLIIKLSENHGRNRRETGATNENAEFQTMIDYVQTDQ